MKILLPVDGSPHSDRVTRHVIQLAQHCSTYEIILLNVQTPIDASEVLGHMPAREIEATQETRGGDAMASARVLLDAAGVAYQPKVVLGPVAESIAGIAGERRCDAIVMGSHGASFITSVLMGSVVAETIRLAPCPVTVVK